MAKRSRHEYYLIGYEEGEEAAQTNWRDDHLVMIKDFFEERMGEWAGDILYNRRQYSGDFFEGIGYTDHQIEKAEEGFYDGFIDMVRLLVIDEARSIQ